MDKETFKNYIVASAEQGYKADLKRQATFSEILLIHGEKHSLIDLKVFSPKRKKSHTIAAMFKDHECQWYLDYLRDGGKRLFVAFAIDDGYGFMKVTRDFIFDIEWMTYYDLQKKKDYNEFASVDKLVKGIQNAL